METFSALLAICAGNSPVPGEFPHKGHWHGALMFSLSCTRINGCVNYGESGDLRRHRANYDTTVMNKNVEYNCGTCQYDIAQIWTTTLDIWLPFIDLQGAQNPRKFDCLFKSFFSLASNKISKLRITDITLRGLMDSRLTGPGNPIQWRHHWVLTSPNESQRLE